MKWALLYGRNCRQQIDATNICARVTPPSYRPTQDENINFERGSTKSGTDFEEDHGYDEESFVVKSPK